jgi:hypothetical protein
MESSQPLRDAQEQFVVDVGNDADGGEIYGSDERLPRERNSSVDNYSKLVPEGVLSAQDISQFIADQVRQQ